MLRQLKTLATSEATKVGYNAAIYRWDEDSKMQFSAGNFQALGYQNLKMSNMQTRERLGSPSKIQHVSGALKFSNNGSFRVHITNLVMQYRQLAGWIRGTFKTREKDNDDPLERIIISRLDFCS